MKEERDKRLLHMEIIMGILCILPLFISIIIVGIFSIQEWLGRLIIGTSIIPLLIATSIALKIEQKARCYECGKNLGIKK